MPEPTWSYDPRVHRYRRNGRFVAFAVIREAAWELAEATGDVVATVTQQLADGQLSLSHWQQFMRLAIKNEHLAQYMVGRGGKAQMTPRDYGIIGAILKEQYRYLDGFAADLAAGKLTPAQAIARARLYILNAQQSFWRGRSEALGMPRLPSYPGAGDTECLVNCRCEWDFQEVRAPDGTLTGWNATWVLDPQAAEVHCQDCPQLANVWNPLWVPAGMTPAEARAWYQEERGKVAYIIQAEHGHSGYDHNAIDLGGPGSGNWGHAGRPGDVGGSAPRESGMSLKTGKDWLERYRERAGKAHREEAEIEQEIITAGKQANQAIAAARDEYAKARQAELAAFNRRDQAYAEYERKGPAITDAQEKAYAYDRKTQDLWVRYSNYSDRAQVLRDKARAMPLEEKYGDKYYALHDEADKLLERQTALYEQIKKRAGTSDKLWKAVDTAREAQNEAYKAYMAAVDADKLTEAAGIEVTEVKAEAGVVY